MNYGMIATGNHFNFDSLCGAPPLVSKGSLWVLSHRHIYLFQQYFYAGKFIMAGGTEEDRPCSERESKALEEKHLFSPGASPDSGASARPPPTKTPPRICGERHPVPAISGSSGRGQRRFLVFWQIPELGFSGFRPLLPPESLPRPLLLFETGRIQTATVA